MTDRLYLAAIPKVDLSGTCHRFYVERPDMKHLTADDLNRVRVAFGQEPLGADEIAAYGIDDWDEAARG